MTMSRTRRLRSEIEVMLRSGPANTVEIFDHLNSRFKWGATMNQVGNILAKDSRFSKIGQKRGGVQRKRVHGLCMGAQRVRNSRFAIVKIIP